jgi:ribosomal protein S18 acetylase RimI-like enzyme
MAAADARPGFDRHPAGNLDPPESAALVLEPISEDNFPILRRMLGANLPGLFPPGDPAALIRFDPLVSHLAKLGDRYVGEVTAYFDLDSETEALFLYVSSISICEGFRRRGLGGTLLASVIAQASEAAYVALHVAASNAAAQGLYARFGFEVRGRVPRFYADDDALVMRADR